MTADAIQGACCRPCAARGLRRDMNRLRAGKRFRGGPRERATDAPDCVAGLVREPLRVEKRGRHDERSWSAAAGVIPP